MTKFSGLIDLCEADLADSGNATWSEADIEQWCIDAVADYLQHFQRELSTDLTTSLNDRTYDLPATLVGIVSVEYPQGEDPPKYLAPRSHTHPNFWTQVGFYDHLVVGDDTDVDEIWISEKPAANETIRVRYRAHHALPADASDDVTVPDEHQHILRNYVLWRAALQLKTIEETSPTSNSSLLMSQYAINVDRLRRAYVDSLAKALYAVSKSKPVSWADQADELDRIY